MEFIDHTGHIFSLPSYSEYPFGYEYEELPYIFWMNSDYTFNLSINNYYIKPIRALIANNKDIKKISAEVYSSVYTLIDTKILHDEIANNGFNGATIKYEDMIIEDTLVLYDKDNNIDKVVNINETGYKYLYYNTYKYKFNGVEHYLTLNNGIYEFTDEDGNIVNPDLIKYTAEYGENVKPRNCITINNALTQWEDKYYPLYPSGEEQYVIYKGEVTEVEKTTVDYYGYIAENGLTVKLIKCSQEFVLVPLYVAAKSWQEGSFITNILIHAEYDDNTEEYCPISVGGNFQDEIEQLKINGKNMGINLPKDIVRAFYNVSYNNEYANETIYNEKLKELLLNYMSIKGECGNYKSAISALKWFGWDNKVTISKLLQTTNTYIDQFIVDYFDINVDIISLYKNFKNSVYIKLTMPENVETGELYPQDTTNAFWGEGLPKLKDYFSDYEEVKYDEMDISFYKPYYEYTFNEMLLKLYTLKYYYEKYFLPIHLKIHSTSLTHKVYANNIKFINRTSYSIAAKTCLVQSNSIDVDFDDAHDVFNSVNGYNIDDAEKYYHYMYVQKHYIDRNFIEFKSYVDKGDNNDDPNVFYIDDYCVSIPIKISNNISDESYFYDCILILSKDNEVLYKSNFKYCEPDKLMNFIISPKNIDAQYSANDWENSNLLLSICVNGKWFYHNFMLKIPDLFIETGKLVYNYIDIKEDNNGGFRQLISLTDNTPKFLVSMYEEDLVKVSNSNLMNELEVNKANLTKYVKKYYRENPNIVNNPEYLNKCYIYDIYNSASNSQIQTTDEIEWNNFFNIDGTEKEPKEGFDLYIMKHANDTNEIKYWYAIYISKNTINIKYNNLPKEIFIGNCRLKYAGEDTKFLINRMAYIKTTNFNTNDVIVCRLVNGDKYKFRLSLGSKWKFTPLSIGMLSTANVSTNTNMALISIGKGNAIYEKGYYNVTVRYTLDNNTQQQLIKNAKIKVG